MMTGGNPFVWKPLMGTCWHALIDLSVQQASLRGALALMGGMAQAEPGEAWCCCHDRGSLPNGKVSSVKQSSVGWWLVLGITIIKERGIRIHQPASPWGIANWFWIYPLFAPKSWQWPAEEIVIRHSSSEGDGGNVRMIFFWALSLILVLAVWSFLIPGSLCFDLFDTRIFPRRSIFPSTTGAVICPMIVSHGKLHIFDSLAPEL